MPRHPQGQHRGPAAAAPRQQQHRWRRLLARREPCLWLRQLLPARLLMRMGNCQAPQMRAVSCFLARPQPLRLSGYAVCNATQMLQQGHQPVAALGPAGDAKPRRWCAPAAGWLRRASLCRLHQRQHRGQPRRLQQLRASRPAQTAGTHFQTAGCCLPTVKVGTRISRLRRCRLWPQVCVGRRALRLRAGERDQPACLAALSPALWSMRAMPQSSLLLPGAILMGSASV